MKDEKTLAYINLFAILGSIPKLCKECSEARELIKDKKISIGFLIKDGPCGTLVFNNGDCYMLKKIEKPGILLRFSNCKKFNEMIDGSFTPIPLKGLFKAGFLLKKFIPLTEILSKYLKATEDELKDKEFFRVSTILMFNVITEAVSHIGNHDKVGRVSASYTVDGYAKIEIKGYECAYIFSRNHTFETYHKEPDDFDAYMTFETIELARDLFDGKINSMAAVGLGKIRVGGMVSMMDNINRILNRVSFYLS